MEIVYIILIFSLILFCAFLCFKLYQFSLFVLNMETAVEECLDILNARYESMNVVLQTELFFDSVEVRQVIADIKASHLALSIVASKLTDEIGFKSEIKKESS
jgi:hypothetical protein